MDKDDLEALLVGAPAEEVDRVHRLLHEWSIGPDHNFPVQLALLTKAQWRIAATVPRLMNDSRKLIAQHLAEYRQQTKTMVDDFSGTARKRTEELKTTLEAHARATKETASAIRANLNEVESVASQIRDKLDEGASQLERSRNALGVERLKFQSVCEALDDRLARWNVLGAALGGLLILALGVGVGHYVWTR
jgi:hypothetical protein